MPAWDAKTYNRFEAERARPSRDLLARVPLTKPRRVLDLGCGSGLSTEALIEAFPDAEVVGVDTSADMLKAAGKRAPKARFVAGDAANVNARGFNLVFANALFHWVPGHLDVMARIVRTLPARGALAAQMPDNDDEPSHRLMREIARLPAFRGKAAPARERIRGFGDYAAALSPSCKHLDIWRTTYVHRLGSPDDIVKWVEGAGLRPYLDPLDAPARTSYLAAYREAIAEAYPPGADGMILFPFPRLFIVAARG